MAEERLSIRLTEKQKKTLEEMAKKQNLTITDMIRDLIIKGDVVRVLGEQLLELVEDFEKWHMMNRSSSILFISDLALRTSPTQYVDVLKNFLFVNRDTMQNEQNILLDRIREFMRPESQDRDRVKLIALIEQNNKITRSYEGYTKTMTLLLNILPERDRERVESHWNDNFKIRYNEFAPRYENFLKRVDRELDAHVYYDLNRVKDFPPHELPWKQKNVKFKEP